MQLAISSADLEACKTEHRNVLINLIRNIGSPSDGAIRAVMDGLECLERIIPEDDRAGRGLSIAGSAESAVEQAARIEFPPPAPGKRHGRKDG